MRSWVLILKFSVPTVDHLLYLYFLYLSHMICRSFLSQDAQYYDIICQSQHMSIISQFIQFISLIHISFFVQQVILFINLFISFPYFIISSFYSLLYALLHSYFFFYSLLYVLLYPSYIFDSFNHSFINTIFIYS